MKHQWIETLTGSLQEKKQYKQAKARMEALPQPYRIAAQAVARYIMYYGGITNGGTIVQIQIDLADLWEQAAADDTPIREIVSDDPVEFTETFVQAYGGKRWIDKERTRLVTAIDSVAHEGR